MRLEGQKNVHSAGKVTARMTPTWATAGDRGGWLLIGDGGAEKAQRSRPADGSPSRAAGDGPVVDY